MKIIEPKVELWKQEDPIAHVAKCARVCYGNAVSKGEEADKKLYEGLKKSGHLSMFRHESIYAIISENDWDAIHLLNVEIPAHRYDAYLNIKYYEGKWYFATNGNWMIDNAESYIVQAIKDHQVDADYFANTEVGHSMMRYTFHIITQISTSRELNRASPNNIAERSTRYVNESEGIICRPHWISEKEANDWDMVQPIPETNAEKYLDYCYETFEKYEELLNKGMKREDARGVLPLDTATEVIYTYSIDEWKRIIKLRTDKRAHPNARIVINMVKEELEKLGYEF